MSEFSPTEKEICQQDAFLSDDEGNAAHYFAQRYMEIDNRDQTYSPEQYENMINSSREFEQKNSRFLNRQTSKFVEEEISISTPHRTKSRLLLASHLNLDEISMQNFKPTDYTYARSCTYRRSSPTEKKSNNPVLRRKSLHMIAGSGLNRAETFFYQSDSAEDNELRQVYASPLDNYNKSAKSWYSSIVEWFTRKKCETRNIFTSINGVPPQFKNQSNFGTVERRSISTHINEIFMYFYLIFARIWSIFEYLILRSKNIFSSGMKKSSTSNGGAKIVLVNNDSMTESESEIATKEIRTIVTEEIVVDEFAKDNVAPKRSAFYWPCLFCFLLPLLFLLPICFIASRSDNSNSTLYNYSMFLWDRCFSSSALTTSQTATVAPCENKILVEKFIDEESLKKYEFHLNELQKRITALEGANDGASNDLEIFREKLSDLAAEATLLKDLSGKINVHLTDMNDFRTKLKSLEDAVDSGANEQKLWQLKLKDLISAHDRRNDELIGLRDKIDSLSKADCNCSFIVAGENVDFAAAGISSDDVNGLIAAAISKYDADKTGLADYALEPAGGAVISIRCTKTHSTYTRKISWWRFPFYYQDYSPRTVIQPGLAPGECWAFEGNTGYLVIKLSWTIQVTAVSYEHIARSISPDGHIDSAPKRMEIYGLQYEYDEKPVLLGEFVYDDQGTPLQYFPIETKDSPAVPFVELKVTSNHGHPVYTCMYRFRVHGRIVKNH